MTRSSPPHDAPVMDCQCGFWAMRRRAELEEWLTGMGKEVREGVWTYHVNYPFLPQSTDLLVLGQVVMWGKVVTCEHGWRSSRARVLFVVDAPETAHLPYPRAPMSEMCDWVE